MSDTNKLTKEELVKLQTTVQEAVKLIKEISSNYDSKVHYKELGPSVIQSIRSTIGTIIGSTEYLNGFYLMCDEIHPEKLAKYLIEKKKYNVSSEAVLYFTAFYLKRKINSLYKEIKNNSLSSGLAMTLDKKGFNDYKNKCYERYMTGIKLLNS